MKVLMVDQFLPQSVYTLELCRELRKYAQITVFCKRGAAADLEHVCWKDGLYEGGKGKIAAVWEYGRGLHRLEREIRKGGYAIVHVQAFKDARYEIPLYCRAAGTETRLVHTVHNLLPHEASAGDRERYTQFYHRCDLLIVHNEYCRNRLMEEYGIDASRICVTPHGSYTQIHKKMETDGAEKKEKVQFLQFGILRGYKGIDILLRALADMSVEERQKLHVTIAGAQHPKLDATDYQAMIEKLGVGDCVTLMRRHIPDGELDALYQDTDLCLFPYREIYGSGALLMAYSYGKPVIASDIPVFQEETEQGKTGLLFASQDPGALKKAILEAVSWDRKTYQGCQSVIEELTAKKYNWGKSAKILAEAYQNIWEDKQK